MASRNESTRSTNAVSEPATVALLALGGALGGAVLTLIGTVITQYVAGRREDQRREHEREIKRMELEDNRQERRRQERLEAYKKFHAACGAWNLYLSKATEGLFEVTPEVRRRAVEELATANVMVILTGTDAVADAAKKFFDAVSNVEPGEEVAEEEELHFLEAARADVGQLPGFRFIRESDESAPSSH
jgi:hypothetical protein